MNVKEVQTPNRNSKLLMLAIAALFVVAVFIVRYRANPHYIGLGSDSGLFAYGGQQILDGAVLYQDVWDTKPPGVFYINALALAIGGGGPWALWGFETFWAAATVVVLLFVLSNLFDWISGSVATALFTFTALYPGYVEGGNFTETWALLPQVLTLVAAIAFFRSGRQIWLVAVGVLTATVFLLKPTYIALGIATVATAFVTTLQVGDRSKAWSHIGFFSVGFLGVFVAALGYWAANGALEDLWNAVIRQNVSYVQEGLSLRSIYGTGRQFLLEQPMVTLTILTATSLVLFLVRRDRIKLQASQTPEDDEPGGRRSVQRKVLIAAFLALPLEIGFVAISGRNFGHYFLTPLPAMAVSVAYLFDRVLDGLKESRRPAPWLAASLTMVGMLLVSWMFAVLPDVLPDRVQINDLISRPFTTGYLHDDLEKYVISHTTPEDSVLVWGYNPRLHYITERRAPSRYLFHAQLITPGLAGEERFDQFLGDLENDAPTLIFAQPQSQHAVPFFGAAEGELCANCTVEGREGLRRLNEFVDQEYELETTIEDWLIYRKKDQT